MNKLPKDMVGKLIDELSPQDFISFCSSNVDPNVTRICHMDEIWARRLRRDFEELVNKFPNIITNPRKVYLKIFTDLSKLAENLSKEVIDKYGESVNRFFSPEFKKFLYIEFYDIALDIVIQIVYDEIYEESEYERFDDWISDSVDEIFSKSYMYDFINKYFPGVPTIDGKPSGYWEDRIQDPAKNFAREIIFFLRKY